MDETEISNENKPGLTKARSAPIDIEILNERDNPILKRKEVKFNVIYEGPVPSLKEIRGKLLSVLNSAEKLTLVDKIEPEFGRSVVKCYAKVYFDENSMKGEPEYMLRKNFEEKKPEEKPAEKKPELKEEKTKPEKKSDKEK